MRFGIYIAIFTFGLLIGCKNSQPLKSDTADGNNCGAALTDSSSDDLNLQAQGQITFYKDVYPILTSQKSGEVYKCVTCHSSYLDPGAVGNVNEISAMVTSMRSGRMPVSGDRVKDEYIQTIEQWRLTGFVIGDRSQIPPDEIDPSVYKSSAQASNCP